jgi:hypothetical protein
VNRLPETNFPKLWIPARNGSQHSMNEIELRRKVRVTSDRTSLRVFLVALCVAGACASASTTPTWGRGQTQQAPSTRAPNAQGQNQAQAEAPALEHRLAEPARGADEPQTIALTVPKGTPVQVALDRETRLGKVGQPIHGHVVEAVYAFDKLVIPAGTEANGHITEIGAVPGSKRAMSALNADFTPARKVEMEFTELLLPGGRRLSIETAVTPGSGHVVQFVTAAGPSSEMAGEKEHPSVAAQRTSEAKQQVKQQWNNAMQEVKAPGKIHRLERLAIAQSPVHPQYLEAGSVYFAELQKPLDFGTETLTPQMADAIAHPALDDGSVVKARLVTPLNSASAHQGDEVQAMVSQPLFDKNHQLVVPEGSMLKGTVLQVQPARHLSRNGQLRPVFHELTPPDGVQEKVEASLAAVEAGKAANVKLDSEGGAEATTPKTRYLTTAVSLGLAAVAGRGDPDAKTPNPAGNPANRAAGGLGGFKLVGMVAGALVQSRAFGYSMGAYGAGVSVYENFMARGRDVVFPKNTAMAIEIGIRPDEGASGTGSAGRDVERQ